MGLRPEWVQNLENFLSNRKNSKFSFKFLIPLNYLPEILFKILTIKSIKIIKDNDN
jgi:hypothetical protein